MAEPDAACSFAAGAAAAAPAPASSDDAAATPAAAAAAAAAAASSLDLSPPEIVPMPSRPVALIPFSIPASQMGPSFGSGCKEICTLLSAQAAGVTEGDAEARAVSAYFHRITKDTFEFDLCVPTNGKPIQPAGRVVPGRMPPADAPKVATAVLTGNYTGLPAAWPRLLEWVAAGGHTRADECVCEQYIVGPGDSSDPAQWKTRLSVAIK